MVVLRRACGVMPLNDRTERRGRSSASANRRAQPAFAPVILSCLFGLFIDDTDEPIQRVKVGGRNEDARHEGNCQKENERKMAKPAELANTPHGSEGKQTADPYAPESKLQYDCAHEMEFRIADPA